MKIIAELEHWKQRAARAEADSDALAMHIAAQLREVKDRASAITYMQREQTLLAAHRAAVAARTETPVAHATPNAQD